jgi:mannose-1-phosphate guanylyltransferase/mannose-1-phosphate guanylyltransferase/mannose-6-phosphate isomerase
MNKINTYREERPWGRFEKFTENVSSTVKIITVAPGEATSLQTHEGRDEFWRILSGNGEVTIGEDSFEAVAPKEFWVPHKTKHRLSGGTEPLVLLEVSLGHFDEHDIIRLDDKYHR